MLKSVGRYAPAIVAGSALSGFGAAFGRDVYRKAKNQWLLILILLALVGVFFSGLWLFRNYRTVSGTVLKKTGALIVLAASAIAVNAAALIVVFQVAPESLLDSGSGARLAMYDYRLFIDPPILWIVLLQLTCFAWGALVGIRHRSKRALAWEAEEHNAAFLEGHGLQVTDTDEKGNMRLRDINTNTGYRLMEVLDVTGELEFMALGRRNKRAYIHYDDTGKFTDWTGLVEAR